MKRYILIFVMSYFFIGNGVYRSNAQDINSVSLSSLPQSCLSVSLQELSFSFPLVEQSFSEQQKQHIAVIFQSGLVERCTLQIQYDVMIQKIIRNSLATSDFSDEEFDFSNELTSISHQFTSNKINILKKLRGVLFDTQWQNATMIYTNTAKLKTELSKQEMKLHGDYQNIINLFPTDSQFSFKLLRNDNLFKGTNKLFTLFYLISNLDLTFEQQTKLYNVQQKLLIEENMNEDNQRKNIQQLLTLLLTDQNLERANNSQDIIRKIIVTDYMMKDNQIKIMTDFLKLLTIDQKRQLKEKYIIIQTIH